MDLLILGNVQTILDGEVNQKTLHPVSLNKMLYALGGAVIPNRDPLSLGETMIYEGIGHIFTVQETYVEKERLSAAFLMGIDQKPKKHFKVTEKQSINALYQKLIEKYPRGFAIVGKALFSKLSAAYLKLSPIYGENINVLHDKYWSHEELSNREVQLFGVVLAEPDARAFYKNPNEREDRSLASHTHVLIPEARHLLTDSELVSATFWIEEIEKCIELIM